MRTQCTSTSLSLHQYLMCIILIVQGDGGDSSKLPTSHTCFNTLLLPAYESREKLEQRLRLAIMNAEGFGLE